MFLGTFPNFRRRNTDRPKIALAVALASTAGFMDAAGYLLLHHLFTAHMTGNTSKLGVALAHGDLARAAPLALAPALFVVGIALGTVAVDRGHAWAAIAGEAALVAAFMGYGSTVVHGDTGPARLLSAFYVLAALATVALGLQTAALTEINGSTVRTSYISGVLTNLAQGAVRRGRDDRPLRLLLAIALLYLAGATLGAYTLGLFSVWCLAIPLGVLVAAAFVSG
jgi:uncharacterized membrane protein YoaK (UPF0700 family)